MTAVVPEEPSIPVAEIGPPRPPRQTIAVRVLSSVTAVLFATACVSAVLTQRDSTEAGDVLQRVFSFVDTHPTASFAATHVEVYDDGGDDGLGYESADRSRAEGVLSLPSSSRARYFAGEYVLDYVVVAHGAYHRQAEDVDGIEAQPWVYTQKDAPSATDAIDGVPSDEQAAMAASWVTASLGGPAEMIAALRRAEDIERVSDGVIRISIDPESLVPREFVEFVPAGALDHMTVTVELTANGAGRLDRLNLVVRNEEPDDEEADEDGLGMGFASRIETDIRFTGWGEPVELGVPPLSAVDTTPGVDEEAVGAYAGPVAYAPALDALPAGWLLQWAEVHGQDDDAEQCEGMTLSYGGADAATLDVSVVDASCPYATDPEDADNTKTVTVGGRSVRLSTYDYGDGDIERTALVGLGRSLVSLTSFEADEATLLRYVGALEAFTLDRQPIETSVPPTAA